MTIISSIIYPTTSTNTKFVIVKPLPSLVVIPVVLFLLLLTPSSSSSHQVLAFGESPIGNLDAVDLTLPSLADFDERIQRYNEWMNQSSDVERGLFVPFELVREKPPSASSSSSSISDLLSASSSGERSSTNKVSEMMMNNNHNNIHEYHLKMIAKRNIGTRQPEVRIPAKMILSYHTICPKAAKRRILRATIDSRRRNLTNYHSSLREQQELSQKEQELEDMMHVFSSSTNENGNEPFCIISEYLYDLASEQETCSLQKEQGRFESGFEQTMLTLFIAYSRWGNHSGFSKATTSPAYDFFKPMIDLFPRVPASPVCTFTDLDLSIFPQANEIKNERMKLESQWKHSILGRIFDNSNNDNNNSDENSKNTPQEEEKFRIVTNADGTTRKLKLFPDAEADLKQQELKDRVRSLFHTMFPEDSLTLPRFFWASCVLKSRVTNCFTSGVPCVFPVLDLAEYRTELTTYTPRVADWNTVRGFKTFLAYVERPGEGSNTLNGPGGDDEKDDTSIVDQKQQQNEEESPLKKKKKKLRKLRNRKKSNTNTNEEEENTNEEHNNNKRKQQEQKPRGMMKIFPRDNFFQSIAAKDTPDNVLALLQFDNPVKSGHELRLDRERRALPFIHSGVIDKNDHLKCVSVRLPTQSMYDKYVEHIVNKADELKSISPKDIFDDPADIHIAPLFSECIGFIFDKAEPLMPPPVNGNDDHDDETSSKNTPKKQEEIPFTCLHANPNAIQQLAQWITKLGLYDQTCTRETLETQPAVTEDTPENALRSVALLGKLVRSQLERVSKSLSKIEPYIAKFRLLGDGSSSASRKDKTGAFASVNDDPSTMKNLFKKQEMVEEEEIDRTVSDNNKNKKKSKKSKKNKQKEQALREYRKMVEEDKKKNIFTSSSTSEDKKYQLQQQLENDETTLQTEQQQQQQDPTKENQKHADSTNNDDDDSSVVVDETDDDDDSAPSKLSFLSKSIEEQLSSCSPESPTTCRILQDPRLPRHALLIHEWLLNEHDGLLKIYDTLTSMRDVVRKAAASYHRSSSSSLKENQQHY